jgi:hypothetical protein
MAQNRFPGRGKKQIGLLIANQLLYQLSDEILRISPLSKPDAAKIAGSLLTLLPSSTRLLKTERPQRSFGHIRCLAVREGLFRRLVCREF